MHDFRIEHEPGRAVVIEYDDTFAHADHVRRHSHALMSVRFKRIEQVLPDRRILDGCGLRWHGQEQLVSHNRSDHRARASYMNMDKWVANI